MEGKKKLIEEFEYYKKRIEEEYYNNSTVFAFSKNVDLLFECYKEKMNSTVFNLLIRYNEFIYEVLK